MPISYPTEDYVNPIIYLKAQQVPKVFFNLFGFFRTSTKIELTDIKYILRF